MTLQDLACMDLFHQVRYPITAKSRPALHGAETLAAVWSWCCLTNTMSHSQRSQGMTPARSVNSRKRVSLSIFLTAAVVWNTWFFVCTLASAPSALYSSAQAIPGFLGMSRTLQWL
eukprot:2214789-Amphidinium_carterae.1